MVEKKNNKKKKNVNQNNSKVKSNMNKTPKYIIPPMSENSKMGYCEYVMSLECANDILSSRNKSEEKIDAQKYLCDYVNDHYGLMEYCVCVKYA